MLRMILAAALAAFTLGGLPGTTRAEALGRISAYVDGTPAAWHTVTMMQGGRVAATASLTRGARLTELNIQGHPEPRFTARDVFSVDVRYLGPYGPEAEPLSVDVIHVPEGMGGPFWTSRGAPIPARVEIVELEAWGNYGRLVATFQGQLCRREIISSATDPTDCRAVTGVIDTGLLVE